MCRYQYSIISLIIFVLLFLPIACEKSPPPFECTDTIACVDIAPGEPIEIGVIQALSKGPIQFGKEQVNSIELAIAQRGNQLLDHPIKLQIEDEQCLPEGGTNTTLRIVSQPQMVAILGTTCSGAAVTAAKVMTEAGLVMISGGNGAPSLTAVGGEQGSDWQSGYFRTMWNGAEQGRTAALFAFQELGVTKAATMNDSDAYTHGSTTMFGQTFMALGGEIVLDITVNKGDTDMHPVLNAVVASESEFLFFPLFSPEGNFVVQQAKEIDGLENIILMASAALQTEDFIQAVGADAVGMYFAVPAPPVGGAANDKLVSDYTSRYGEPPSTLFYGYAYDAANILLNAIEVAAIQEENGTIHIGRQALRDALYATADFEGVTGRLSCDTFGDCGVGRLNVMRLDDPTAGLEELKANVIYTYTQEK